jgi:hypothetical protein
VGDVGAVLRGRLASLSLEQRSGCSRVPTSGRCIPTPGSPSRGPENLADDEFESEGSYRALLCLVGVVMPDETEEQLVELVDLSSPIDTIVDGE